MNFPVNIGITRDILVRGRFKCLVDSNVLEDVRNLLSMPLVTWLTLPQPGPALVALRVHRCSSTYTNAEVGSLKRRDAAPSLTPRLGWVAC
eukprot:scaffold36087_cov30-Phaeocystis_antarctica.AAC.2